VDYEKTYNSIVKHAKNRELKQYKEQHHIVPKCLKGTDSPENLVYLTAREHFIAHLLLTKIYPSSKKLKYAAWAMANQTSRRGYKVSARTYETLKEDFINIKSSKVKIKCDNCNKIFLRQPSQTMSLNFCSRDCYISSGGVTKGEVHIFKGKRRKFVSNKDLKLYLDRGWKEGRPYLHKKVIQLNTQGRIINTFDSVKEATSSGMFSVTGISQCANRKRKTHKGFVWRYLDNT